MLKRIIFLALILFNFSLLFTLFFLKEFNSKEYYFAHIVVLSFLFILIYGYELFYGNFRYLKSINNLIDLPITKSNASLLDFTVLLKSPALLLTIVSNYSLIILKNSFNKDISFACLAFLLLFGFGIIVFFINVHSFLKGFLNGQTFATIFFLFVFLFQILNFKFDFFMQTIAGLSFWIPFLILNILLILSRYFFIKNWK